MKKALAIILSLLVCVMSGCHAGETAPAAAETVAQTQPTHEITEPVPSTEATVAITESTTQPTEAPAAYATEQHTIDETVPETTVPCVTATNESHLQETIFPEAEQTDATPPETSAPIEYAKPSAETESETSAVLDCELAMNAGNQYGSDVYGWIVDSSLNESNAGFNFGSWVFAEDGQAALDAAGIGQIDFLYNSLKAAYPDMEITGIRFRVHAFACGDGLYEVRVYYA